VTLTKRGGMGSSLATRYDRIRRAGQAIPGSRGAQPALLVAPTKSAHQIDDKADQQNQANPSSADDGPSKVKTAAAEQDEKDHYKE
jgi:hypothetical protein